MPSGCQLSKLLVKYYHLKTLHGGIRLTLSSLRQEFWLIKGRYLVKQYIHKCHSCLIYGNTRYNEKMGILPSVRVEKPDKPFRFSGVDYAGPYDVLRYRGRGSATYKAYIAIFVCLSTRAVHGIGDWLFKSRFLSSLP